MASDYRRRMKLLDARAAVADARCKLLRGVRDFSEVAGDQEERDACDALEHLTDQLDEIDIPNPSDEEE